MGSTSPETPLGQQEYLPIIDYWNHRSDNVTDFFCGGFFHADSIKPLPRDSYPVPQIRHEPWFFSSQLLSSFVNEIEQRSSWRPSGGFDVIICTARYNEETRIADLDFTAAVCITLEDGKKTGAVRDLSHLLTMVFEFAKSINEDTTDAAWVWSDRRGLYVLKKTLKAMIESWLPKWLRQGGQQAEIFAVRDIRP